VRAGVDLTQQHFLFIGTIGLLLVGPKAHEYDAYVLTLMVYRCELPYAQSARAVHVAARVCARGRARRVCEGGGGRAPCTWPS
jgi:hypothetical protein